MRLEWDKTSERYFETGVDHGVLYVYDNNKDNGQGVAKGGYGTGVAWNGLTGVTESPSGAEANAFWADNIKYLNLMSAEDFGCTIEAYTYPDEWAECDGSAQIAEGVMIGQQKRKMFGFCYRTVVGNDTEGTDLGYKIHIVYGCMASPSERGYQTINESPEPITFSWEVSTTPVDVSDIDGKKFKPTAHLEIDSTRFNTPELKAKLTQIEDTLYGSTNAEPTLLLPNKIATMLAS